MIPYPTTKTVPILDEQITRLFSARQRWCFVFDNEQWYLIPARLYEKFWDLLEVAREAKLELDETVALTEFHRTFAAYRIESPADYTFENPIEDPLIRGV